MAPAHRILHLALIGGMSDPLKLLLQDVLTEGGLRCELSPEPAACDVIVAIVSWGDEARVIAEARALPGKVPLLAILPFTDDDLAQRVLLAGAQGWFALDTPLALLRAALVRLADLGSPAEDHAA